MLKRPRLNPRLEKRGAYFAAAGFDLGAQKSGSAVMYSFGGLLILGFTAKSVRSHEMTISCSSFAVLLGETRRTSQIRLKLKKEKELADSGVERPVCRLRKR